MSRLVFAFTLALAGVTGCLDPSEGGNLVPATADQDPDIPQLQFNGSTFHVETFGDPADPVVVVLHGGPGGDFRGLLRLLDPAGGRTLDQDHFLVFWDQRGSGLSQRHAAADITIDAYDADLDWVIDHFSPGRPVVLIGHSWGGMYAAEYIGRHPDKVAGAVLMEAGPLTGALFDELADRIIEIDFFSEWLNDYTWAYRVISPDDHARADYLSLLGPVGDAQPGYHQSTTDRMPTWRPGAVAGAAIQQDGMEDGEPVWDFTVGLDSYPHPVLFEASAQNEVIGESLQRRQMAFFADAELSIIPDCGHDFPWTRPAATLRPVFDYLDQIGF